MENNVLHMKIKKVKVLL